MTQPRSASEQDWAGVRSVLRERRYELGVRAGDLYLEQRVAGTPLLAGPGWVPTGPVRLADVALELDASEREVPARLLDAASGVLPMRADGCRYARYSEAMRELAAPRVFENRPTYQLTGAGLAGRAPALSFRLGRYFDGIDVGEAAAHEFVAGAAGRVRAAVGNPCDLGRRPANLAISTLTLLADRGGGKASFLMHWRDPATVGHAGGLYQVVPVGVFQPSGGAAANVRNDFSLWRCIVREFAEELLGHGEEYGGPIDYDAWPVARRLSAAPAWCLGLGTDPLTFATDLLTVLVLDEEPPAIPARNAEGTVLPPQRFDAATIERFAAREPVQAAGAALLRLAWAHRDVLLRR